MKDSLKFIGKALFIISIIVVIYNSDAFEEFDVRFPQEDYDNSVTSTPNPFPECNQKTKVAKSFCKFASKGKAKVKENKIESRADASNQYNNLEECLSDDKEIDSRQTRAEWCDSEYVLIKSSDIN